MAKIAYPKQIKSLDDQISILKSRGMVIKDEARAKQIFAQVQKPPTSDMRNHLNIIASD